MQYKYKTKYLKISPRKLRFYLVDFKDKNALLFLESLKIRREKSCFLIAKSLKSAIAAAKEKGAEEEKLEIKSIAVDQGPSLKRRLIKPRGRADLILKRMSHLLITLKDKRKKKAKQVDVKDKI